MDNEKDNNKVSLSLLPWDQFDNIQFPEQKWRIKDLIPAQGLVIIAAPSGEKKSWLGMEMAKCIASGTNFLGEAKFETYRANVLYIEQETVQSDIQRRGRQLGLNKAGGIWLLSCDSLSLNDPRAIEELYKSIQQKNIEVIFIDTFRSVSGGIREEKAEEIREFFQRFKPWKDRGRVVIFLDHCRKPRQFENSNFPKKDQLLGSQDKVAAVEILIMLKSQARSEEIFVYPSKSKLGLEMKPFKIFIKDETEEDKIKTLLTYGGEIEDKKLKVDQAKELVLDYLAEQEVEKSAQDMQDTLGITVGKTAIEDALKDMRENGEIGYKKEGRKYLYYLIGDDSQPNFLIS